MAQGSRICLTMQETSVPSLVLEDSTRRRATKPVHPQLLRALASKLLSPCNTRTEAPHPRVRAPQREAHPFQLESCPCLSQVEKSPSGNEDSAQPKRKKEKRMRWWKQAWYVPETARTQGRRGGSHGSLSRAGPSRK